MKHASGQSARASGAPSSRQQRRQERQARVGILRNPNSPPVPPPRRAKLMGKWPRLRSSRRPPDNDQAIPAAAPDALAPQADGLARVDGREQIDAGTQADGGAQIDMAALAAVLEQPDPEPPRRAPFAARYRGIAPSQHPATAPAMRDDDDVTPTTDVDDIVAMPVPLPAPGARRAFDRWRWWTGSVVALGVAGTIVAVSGLN